jgi:DNA-binding NtrC family response regulator
MLPRAEAHAVLFVVDHEDTRDMYAMVLEASGYRVLMAESGAAALAHARNQTVSAVITDVCMPGTVTAAEIYRIFSGVGIPVMAVPDWISTRRTLRRQLRPAARCL